MIAIENLWSCRRHGISAGVLSPRVGALGVSSVSALTGTAVADQTSVGQSSVFQSTPAPTSGTVWTYTVNCATSTTTSIYLRCANPVGSSWVRLRLRFANNDAILDHNTGGGAVTLSTLALPTIAAGVPSLVTVRDDGTTIKITINGTEMPSATTTTQNAAVLQALLTNTSGTTSFTGMFRNTLSQVGGINGFADAEFVSGSISGLTLNSAHGWVLRMRPGNGAPTNRGSIPIVTGTNYSAGFSDANGAYTPFFTTASGQTLTAPSVLGNPGTSPYLLYFATNGSTSSLAMMTSNTLPTIHSAARTLGSPGTVATITGTSSWDYKTELAVLDSPVTAAELQELYNAADWSQYAVSGATSQPMLLGM